MRLPRIEATLRFITDSWRISINRRGHEKKKENKGKNVLVPGRRRHSSPGCPWQTNISAETGTLSRPTHNAAVKSWRGKVEGDICLMSQVHQNNPVIRGTPAVIDALPASLSLPLWRETNEQQTSMGGGRQKTESGKRERRSGDFVGAQYLNPMIGHSLQMLHLAWCLAVSAAATLCKTGSHTMDWGSRRIQSRKRAASISGLLLAWERRRRGK